MRTLPTYSAIEAALTSCLDFFGRPARPKEVYEALALKFELGADQLALRRADGRGSLFANQVQWARNRLVRSGVLKRRPYGWWSLAGKSPEGDFLARFAHLIPDSLD